MTITRKKVRIPFWIIGLYKTARQQLTYLRFKDFYVSSSSSSLVWLELRLNYKAIANITQGVATVLSNANRFVWKETANTGFIRFGIQSCPPPRLAKKPSLLLRRGDDFLKTFSKGICAIVNETNLPEI